MCLILARMWLAVWQTPVAHQRATFDPCQPWRPKSTYSSEGSIEPDSILSASSSPRWISTPCNEEAMTALVPSRPPSTSPADNSLEVRLFYRMQIGHALTCWEFRKRDDQAKQSSSVLKQVAQLECNQLPKHEPGEPNQDLKGNPMVLERQRDSTATSSDEGQQQPGRRRNHTKTK